MPDDAATFDLPAIEVVKGITITGRLVNAEDRPIADAGVHASDGLNFRYAFREDRRARRFHDVRRCFPESKLSLPGLDRWRGEIHR